MFSANLHRLDQLARIVLGVGMMAAGWSAPDGVLAFALRIFAFYPLATGIVGWSPAYAILGFRTKR
jgi:hypothetical protein